MKNLDPKKRNTINNNKAGSSLFVFIFLLASCYGPSAFSSEIISNAVSSFKLNLSQVLARAQENSLLIRVACQQVRQAAGRKQQADAQLLPNLSLGGAQMKVFRENLDSLGFPGGGNLGPLKTFDARAQLVQRVFDLSALSRHQAGSVELRIADFEQDLARQQVTLTAAMTYLAVLNAQERLKAIEKDKALAQQILTLAQHQFDDGIAARIDVTRAKTRLAQEEFLYQEGLLDLDRADLQLKRITSFPLGNPLELTDTLKFFEETALSLEDAIDTAEAQRIEIKITGQEVQYAKYKLQEARNQNFPQVALMGDIGRAGTDISKKTSEVSEIGLQVKWPVFDGGRIIGEVKEAAGKKQENEMIRDDTQIQVEEDVRLALKTLTSSKQQVLAAEQTVILAAEEVSLARNQFASGLSNNLEVITAQTKLAEARESYTAALTQYHIARMNYYSAIGSIESFHL
ncbi:MAG: TolC family protein [Candidatus Omnitrophica bacterium]|nr:TolC family protein [Candidatus Omnitrophota bacterium]